MQVESCRKLSGRTLHKPGFEIRNGGDLVSAITKIDKTALATPQGRRRPDLQQRCRWFFFTYRSPCAERISY
jgi:hypothetical protein